MRCKTCSGKGFLEVDSFKHKNFWSKIWNFHRVKTEGYTITCFQCRGTKTEYKLKKRKKGL